MPAYPWLADTMVDNSDIDARMKTLLIRMKDDFGARSVRVRGATKVMAHLMFGVLTMVLIIYLSSKLMKMGLGL